MCARAVSPTHDRPVSTCSVHAAGRIFWVIAPSDQFGVEARNELQPPHIVAHATVDGAVCLRRQRSDCAVLSKEYADRHTAIGGGYMPCVQGIADSTNRRKRDLELQRKRVMRQYAPVFAICKIVTRLPCVWGRGGAVHTLGGATADVVHAVGGGAVHAGTAIAGGGWCVVGSVTGACESVCVCVCVRGKRGQVCRVCVCVCVCVCVRGKRASP